MKHLLAVLLLSTAGFAQTEIDAPQPKHQFFDKTNSVLLVSSALTIAGDGITTSRIQDYGLHGDVNPIARPFMRNPGLRAAYFSTGFAAETGLMALAHKTGHHKIERLIPMAVSGVETYWTIYNARLISRLPGGDHSAQVFFRR